MGLILSQQIIQKNGGKIDISSEQSRGSTVVFSFGAKLDESQQPGSAKQDMKDFDNTKSSLPQFG